MLREVTLKGICFHSFSDTGNYDIPRSSAASDYDIPRATANEGTYDVPRSYDDLRMSGTDDTLNQDGGIASDIPV